MDNEWLVQRRLKCTQRVIKWTYNTLQTFGSNRSIDHDFDLSLIIYEQDFVLQNPLVRSFLVVNQSIVSVCFIIVFVLFMTHLDLLITNILKTTMPE